MSWTDALAGGVLGAVGGGAVSAWGGYLAVRRQQRLASVAAARLIRAELLRNQVHLREFENAPLVQAWRLKRSLGPERIAWHDQSPALTEFLGNDAFSEVASAYHWTELTGGFGAGRETRLEAVQATELAVEHLNRFVDRDGRRPLVTLGGNLRLRSGPTVGCPPETGRAPTDNSHSGLPSRKE